MSTELRAREAVSLFFQHRCNVVLAVLTAASFGVAGLLTGTAGFLPWSLLGAALWPLWEYLIHRWVLHAPPLPWAWAVQVQRRLHYDHHVDPRRLDLLLAPLWFTLVLPFLVAAVYAPWLPAPAAAGMVAGHMAATLFYEWVHFVAHVPYQPRSAYFRRMKTLHTWHHFKNERYWFGVTAGFMDRATGTQPDAASVPTSPTVRALHGNDSL